MLSLFLLQMKIVLSKITFIVILFSQLVLNCDYESYLLFRNSKSGGDLTIYSLMLPSVVTLYREMMYDSSGHRLTCPAAYIQLLTEAHSLMRAAVSVRSTPLSQTVRSEHLQLYRESCALLADFYLTYVLG